jgi:transposase
MKQGKKGSKNAESELLKELELLREQASKVALLEKENKDLKEKLEDQQEALKENQNLKQQLEQQQGAIEKNEETVKGLTEKWHNSEREIEKLKYLLFEAGYKLEQFKKRFFGSKSERFVPSPADQLVLELELAVLDLPQDTEVISVEYIRRKTAPELKNTPSRMILPEHLAREVVEIHPEGDLSNMIMIGKDITERLEITPARFKVLQEIRFKYKDKTTRKIVTPALPERAVFKAMAGPALTADILVAKFVDAMPLARQISRFERMGIGMAKSTMNDLVKNNCGFLEPLHDLIVEKVTSSQYLQVDETPVKVLNGHGQKGSRQSYHWVYYSPPDKMVLFDFQQGRDNSAPQKRLKNFQGTLQTDDYRAYYQFDGPGVTMAACLAHIRRKFSDALDNDPMARIPLAEFHQLYAIEHNAKENKLDSQGLLQERQQKAAPILQRLKAWVTGYLPKTTPSSPMGRAIAHFLKNWNKIIVYLKDGNTLIDSNPVERCIRKVSIGKKNYMFHGSHEGGCWAAMMYTFFGTCKLHNVNPLHWLTDVLTRMPGYPKDKLADLLPNVWKPELAL